MLRSNFGTNGKVAVGRTQVTIGLESKVLSGMTSMPTEILPLVCRRASNCVANVAIPSGPTTIIDNIG